jgi:hypothetical protein
LSLLFFIKQLTLLLKRERRGFFAFFRRLSV